MGDNTRTLGQHIASRLLEVGVDTLYAVPGVSTRTYKLQYIGRRCLDLSRDLCIWYSMTDAFGNAGLQSGPSRSVSERRWPESQHDVHVQCMPPSSTPTFDRCGTVLYKFSNTSILPYNYLRLIETRFASLIWASCICRSSMQVMQLMGEACFRSISP